MIRHLCAVALLVFAAGCGHKAETTTTTSTATVATTAPAPTAVSSTAPMSAPAAGGSPGAGQPPSFDTEAAAQTHCAADTVVWLNAKTRVYHAKGTQYYGHTKKGAYVCKKEADAAGDHPAKNGA
jgi:hypothetical protein